MQAGQSVLARWWEDKNFYEAQITKVNPDGSYDVYFPEDSASSTVNGDDIKLKTVYVGSRAINRNDIIGRVFYDNGTQKSINKPNFACGEFIVKGFLPNNNCSCQRVRFDDDDPVERVAFDIGYVIKRIRAYEEE